MNMTDDELNAIFSDGFWLAAKVAVAVLEPSDGAFYSLSERADLQRLRHRMIQKIEEAAEAWDIGAQVKP
jgi:hypothetical protein